jgi:RimJ/RimL family protein N-acetyltransferase
VLSTPRLVLRRWAEADLDAWAALCADPEVMRWIGDGATRPPEECARQLAEFERSFEERGFGPFAVALRRTGQCIGMIGLSIPGFLPELLPAVEIGWRLARRQWGRGLATEGGRAVLDFAFRARGLERVVSIHQVGNEASAHVMRRLGMHFERETMDPTCSRPVHVYAITREDWVGR